MRPETLFYVTCPPVFRVQLDGLEVGDVFRVEEHIPHRGSLAVQFEGVSRENYALSDDSHRVWVEERPHRHQIWG